MSDEVRNKKSKGQALNFMVILYGVLINIFVVNIFEVIQ